MVVLWCGPMSELPCAPTAAAAAALARALPARVAVRFVDLSALFRQDEGYRGCLDHPSMAGAWVDAVACWMYIDAWVDAVACWMYIDAWVDARVDSRVVN